MAGREAGLLAASRAFPGVILDTFTAKPDDRQPFADLGGLVTTTLLAVDDSKTMRKVFEITFAGDTYKTVVADGADSARSLLAAEKPAVVLIDANLPGGAAYDLCADVKRSSPAAVVLLLGSKQQPVDKSRSGFDDTMDKPFDTQQLLDRVSNLLKKGAGAPAPAPVAAAPAPAPAAAPRTPVAAPVAAAPAPAASLRPRTTTASFGSSTPATPAATAAPQAPRSHTVPGTPAPPIAHAPFSTRPVVAPAAGKPPASAAPAAPVARAPAEAAPAPAAPAAAPAVALPPELADKLRKVGLTPAQVEAVLALSKTVVEQVVWEVVPVLAETLIKEEIKRLTAE